METLNSLQSSHASEKDVAWSRSCTKSWTSRQFLSKSKTMNCGIYTETVLVFWLALTVTIVAYTARKSSVDSIFLTRGVREIALLCNTSVTSATNSILD
jgi:hypothetical protein